MEPTFRNAEITDLDRITAIESICFPPNEAASCDSFLRRLEVFPDHFWLLEVDGRLIGYINGMVTNNETIIDVMFEDAALHSKAGKWQSIFGIAVLPEFRKSGYAGMLIKHLINQAKEQSLLGLTLTCKDYLISYYERFGFVDLGVSKSVHGGEVWHDMILKF